MSILYRVSVIILSISALLWVSSSALAQERYDHLTRCEVSTPLGELSTNALCGQLVVPENPSDSGPDAAHLELAYAVLPARNGQGLPDPVFFLAGGPGQSAREVAPIMRRALRDIHRNRDLIFLDQRGTGASSPLDCDIQDEMANWLEPDPEAMVSLLMACQSQWPVDVRYFTTTEAVHDLDRLRAELGFDQINLIGGSYGTRVAQVYLKTFPERVRTAILDGIAPMRLALGAEHGPSLDRTLNHIIAACGEDETCNQAFPNLAQAFVDLKNEYDDWMEGPMITLTHPRLGEAIEIPFSRSILAPALRFLAYDPTSQMMVPYLIHEAAVTGQPNRLAAQALLVSEAMDASITVGLNFSVGCTEDWPRWPDTSATEDTLLQDSVGDLYRAICPDWPVSPLAPDFATPYTGDVPLLLLSGELDPVTPPSYGDEVAEHAPNARHIVAKGRGHIVITLPCIGQIAAEFIDSASLEGLNTDCTEALGPEPFFTNLLGSTP